MGAVVLALALATVGCGDDDGGDPGDASVGTDAQVRSDSGPSTGRCGDGTVDDGEECDDGGRLAGDGCSAACELECGDGVVGTGELCDTGIGEGEEGACPTDCDDGMACTSDTLSGTDCSVECVHGDITAAADDDGCCPPDANASTDNDCAGSCGDGFVTGTEACDTAIASGTVGACPASCDDSMSCTTDSLTGGGTCDAVCTNTPITTPGAADSCCPPGATLANDPDCAIACGDGVVSAGEACDTGITSGAGACPTTCNDGAACTTDMLVNAGTCAATCTSTAITLPANGDGCCPPGATIANDSDCTATCGDGVVSGGEACDTGITSGAGRCPTTCTDGMSCTRDVLTGAGTCAATCSYPAITAPAPSDGCCPPGATIATDNDCPVRCGDGVRSPSEACDTAIASGAGACPTTCSDGMVCTTDTLVNAGTCSAACTYPPITTPAAGDGCCPTGANIGNDSDCPRRCGDGVITAPETCDDGNTANGDGCSATCTTEVVPTGFRVRDMDLLDPHAFANVLGCLDITNLDLFGQQGVNPLIQTRLTTDTSPSADGELDLNLLVAFTPLAQAAGSSTTGHVVMPDCTAPLSSTMCTLPAGADRSSGPVSSYGSPMVCLQALDGTTGGYSPAVASTTAAAGAACFTADIGELTINLAGIPITLSDTRIAGRWSGNPASAITNGLIRGFLPVAVADGIVIPPGTTGQAAIDNRPLSALFRGGMNNCSQAAPTRGDRDTHMGMDGWWLYLSYVADRAPYTEL
ncbi:DUF4215 domain-containing protein [Sandaracinus amylolyticus]|uniref:DUF4215 domain-containing protein n=1 Tax=Sandaracinus amylolyticus TaxID=927083 RepID=UPI001F23E2D0|nr:DUF4215 domain-containing protein [Sandaracinus amylolyticus]